MRMIYGAAFAVLLSLAIPAGPAQAASDHFRGQCTNYATLGQCQTCCKSVFNGSGGCMSACVRANPGASNANASMVPPKRNNK